MSSLHAVCKSQCSTVLEDAAEGAIGVTLHHGAQAVARHVWVADA